MSLLSLYYLCDFCSTMLPRRWVILGLLSCFVYATATQHRNRALFPVRMKRGLAQMDNPIFHNSVGDVNLLFEILLSGLRFEDPGGGLGLRDAELASLRKTRTLEVLCDRAVPRGLTDVRRLTSRLPGRVGPLRQGDFERTLLTLVYTAQHVTASTTDHQRAAWAQSLVSLFEAIKDDLMAAR